MLLFDAAGFLSGSRAHTCDLGLAPRGSMPADGCLPKGVCPACLLVASPSWMREAPATHVALLAGAWILCALLSPPTSEVYSSSRVTSCFRGTPCAFCRSVTPMATTATPLCSPVTISLLPRRAASSLHCAGFSHLLCLTHIKEPCVSQQMCVQ